MKQLNKYLNEAIINKDLTLADIVTDRYYIFKIYDQLTMYIYAHPDDFTDFENGKFIGTKIGDYLICTIPKLINIVENILNTLSSQRMLEIIANDFIYMVEPSDITDPTELENLIRTDEDKLFTKLLKSAKQTIKIFKTELGI